MSASPSAAANPFAAFDARWSLPPLPSANQPVFVLAAAWRSGSTLLQRLLCSTDELVIWGEPYGNAGILRGLSAAAHRLLAEDWLDPRHFPAGPEALRGMSQRWVANLYPPPADLRASFRAQLDTLLHRPAARAGIPRFGLKEVRCDVEVAWTLQWLYPDARFVFLVRNPWDAWSSFKGVTWVHTAPDYTVSTAKQFARLWQHNTASFLRWHDRSGLMLRHEDIVTGRIPLAGLGAHCGLRSISAAPLKTRIRGISKPPVQPTAEELATIARTCGELAGKLGYTGLDQTRAL
jgi:hypothetical protein